MTPTKTPKDTPEERRQHPRYPVKSATFTVADKGGEIIDISMGGLAFSYVEREDWDGESFDRGVLMGEQDLYIEDISLKVISDCAINSGISLIRRCGVKFEQLTPKQMAQLEYFIWATGAARGNDDVAPDEVSD